MMKLGLTLLAIGAAANRIEADDDDYGYGEWIWEECENAYYQ